MIAKTNKKYFLMILIIIALTNVVNLSVLANIPNEVLADSFGFDETDATDALQAAINTGAKTVRVRNMGKPWIINKTINLVSDQEVIFEEGVELVAKRGSFHGRNDVLVLASNKKNIVLNGYGATFRMQKADYQGPDYQHFEWRHTLSILSCTNVKIIGLTLADSGGDGIYLGRVAGAAFYNKDIVIRDVVCDNHHRQGISIITVKNLLIEDSIFKNTSGTAPMAGMDFEPNTNQECLVNITVRNCIIENNRNYGITIYTARFNSSSEEVSIKFENCRVIGGEIGLNVEGLLTDNPKGLIEFENCYVEGTQKAGLRITNKALNSAKVVFKDCYVKDTALGEEAPIYFNVTNGILAKCQGAVDFINCSVEHYSSQPFFFVNEIIKNYSIYNVSGDIKVKSPYPYSLELGVTEPEEFNIEISRESIEQNMILNPRIVDSHLSNDLMVLRGCARCFIYAEKGDSVTLNVGNKIMGNNKDKLYLSVLSPSKKNIFSGEIEPGENEQINFNAEQTGVYYVSGSANKNSVEIRSNKPLGNETRGPIHYVSPTGNLHFWLPEGLKETTIFIRGDGVGEQVKATLLNSKGEIVEEKDNISGIAPHTFKINLDQPSEGEVWVLRLEKPGNNVNFEDVFVIFNKDHIPAISYSPAVVF